MAQFMLSPKHKTLLSKASMTPQLNFKNQEGTASKRMLH